MKSEERHELKQNDLSTWFQYGLPMFLKNYGSYLLLGVALCFLGYQLYQMHEQKLLNNRINAINELNTVPDSLLDNSTVENPPEKIKSIIETYDIKEIRALAYLKLGNYYIQSPLFPEKTQNIPKADALAKAQENFQKALDTYRDDTLIAGKATLGLAAVEEDKHNWDAARKIYQGMADKAGPFKDTPFVDLAAARIATLDDRKNAPDLVDHMPPPPTTRSAFDPLNPAGNSFPGLFNNGPTNLPFDTTPPLPPIMQTPPPAPPASPTTAPATTPAP